MAKYSFEFKIQFVHDYLSGQGGTTFLAKKYGFNNNSPMENFFSILKQECTMGKCIPVNMS